MLPVTFRPPLVALGNIMYMLAPTDWKVYFLKIQFSKIKRNSKLLNVLIMQVQTDPLRIFTLTIRFQLTMRSSLLSLWFRCTT